LLCATHNEESIYLSDSLDKNGNVEYAQLMGMSDKLSKKLSEENKVVYKYLPYGHLNETLPYLVRRLYENYPMVLNIFK
jgi:proline dehydrogenase